MFAKWTLAALQSATMSQADLARCLTDRLRRGIDAAAVNKITKGTRALAADEMLAIAAITGYPVLISLEGKLLGSDADRPGVNEARLVKLFAFVLERRGLLPETAHNLGAALLGLARRHPDRPDIDLTEDQWKQIARALADA